MDDTALEEEAVDLEVDEGPTLNGIPVSDIPEDILAAVEKAKKENLNPYWLLLNGFSFIYRPVKRKEWKEMSRNQNRDLVQAQDDSEQHVDIKNKYTEELVNMCILYSDIPIDDNLGAGYVDTLFDAILTDSGFGQPEMPSINMG